jgi:hypothetical protein
MLSCPVDNPDSFDQGHDNFRLLYYSLAIVDQRLFFGG